MTLKNKLLKTKGGIFYLKGNYFKEEDVKQRILLFQEYLKDNKVEARILFKKYKEIFGDFK